MIYTQATWPGVRWPNFTFSEAKCSHTGDCDVDPNFMDSVQALRDLYGKPMKVTSLYRSPSHPVEEKKEFPGTHTMGKAIDIGVGRGRAYRLLELALSEGFTGIGIKQHGSSRFLHLDMVQPGEAHHITRENLWSYQ